MFNTTIVAAVFKLINFFAFVGLLGYLFKQKMLGQLHTKIAAEKAAFDTMVQEHKGLEDQQRDLEHAIVEQKDVCEILKQHVQQWKATFEETVHAREQERAQLQKLLKEKITQQTNYLMQEQIKERVLPQAIKQAEQQLQDTFADEKNGRAYLTDLMQAMEKSG